MPKKSESAKSVSATTAEHLNPLELHALWIFGKKAEKVRDALDAGGGQLVDVTVRITGAVSVGLAESYERNVMPDPVSLLAVVLAPLGSATRKKIAAALDAVYAGLEEGEQPPLEPLTRQLAEIAIDRITKKKKIETRGRVTGALNCEIVARPA